MDDNKVKFEKNNDSHHTFHLETNLYTIITCDLDI